MSWFRRRQPVAWAVVMRGRTTWEFAYYGDEGPAEWIERLAEEYPDCEVAHGAAFLPYPLFFFFFFFFPFFFGRPRSGV